MFSLVGVHVTVLSSAVQSSSFASSPSPTNILGKIAPLDLRAIVNVVSSPFTSCGVFCPSANGLTKSSYCNSVSAILVNVKVSTPSTRVRVYDPPMRAFSGVEHLTLVLSLLGVHTVNLTVLVSSSVFVRIA